MACDKRDIDSGRRNILKGAGAVALSAPMLPFLKMLPAMAAPRDTAVVVIGQTINSLDLHRKGTNRPSYQVAVNCYDRLVSFGTKTLADGTLSYDYATLKPDLAESWTVTDDGMAIVFKLRDNAVFWDGTPVTATDVKWSLDRAISLGGRAVTCGDVVVECVAKALIGLGRMRRWRGFVGCGPPRVRRRFRSLSPWPGGGGLCGMSARPVMRASLAC